MQVLSGNIILAVRLLTLGLIAAAPVEAMAGAGSSSTVLTGPSPYASCDVSAEEGTNYLNAEIEPWIAANPSDPNSMIAAWQQDRWSNGGSRGLVSAFTRNGGQSWSRVSVPGINKCSGGRGDFAFDRSTDPWVAIAPDGTAYFSSLSFFNDRPDGGGGENAMLVSRSTDGGASWGKPTVLQRDTDGRYFNDKNAITADPSDARFVYATWDQLFQSDLPAEAEKVTPQAATPGTGRDGVLIAREHYRDSKRTPDPAARLAAEESYFKGPSYLARTSDKGKSWEPAKIIYDPGINAQTIGNQVVIRKDGGVLVFFSELASGGTKIRFVRSSDHGRNFGPPLDAVFTYTTATGTLTPNQREPVRDANILFDVAIDQTTGHLYLVWQDGRQDRVDRVAFSMSTNGGNTWSQPVIINKTPPRPSKYRTQAFVPSVEVGAGSKVFVTYYDFRNDEPGSKEEMVDYWAISCTPGTADCRRATGWGNETRLTAQSFNILDAPFAGGYFLGDYQGLVRQGSKMRALFAITTGPGLTDVVTRLVP